MVISIKLEAMLPPTSAIFYTPLKREEIRWDEKVDPDRGRR